MPGKTFESIYRKKMYKKIIRVALTIMILPMIIQIVISCATSMRERKIRISELNEQYLSGTATVFSLIINQINDNYCQVMAGDTAEDFEKSYMGKQYEQSKRAGEVSNQKHVYYYLELKKQMNSLLKEIAVSNVYIKSIYFYDADKNIVLTNSGVDYPADSFYDMEWLQEADPNENFVVLPTRNITYGNRIEEQVNSIIFSSINRKGNFMVVNIGYNDVFEKVMQQLPNKSYSNFLVMDEGGSLIYSSNSELSQAYSRYDFEKASYPVSEISEDHLMSYLYDDGYQWFFVVLSDIDSMYENVVSIQIVFWIGTMFLVVATLAVGLYLVDFFSVPLLDSLDMAIRRNGMDGNLTFNSFRTILNKNEKLNEWLAENKPLYRDSFILSLLRIHSIKESEIKQTFELLDIPLELEKLMIAVVRTDFAVYTREHEFSEIVVLSVMIEQLANEMFKNKFNNVCVSKNDSEFIVLIQNSSEENVPEIIGILERMADKLAENAGIVFDIGLSRIANTIHDVPRLYDETISMLRYAVSEKVVNYCGEQDSNDRHKGEVIPYPMHDIKMLSGLVAAGDQENAEKCFGRIKEELIRQSVLMTRNNFKYLVMEILHELIELLFASGYEVETVFGADRDIYSEISDSMDLNLIFDIFETMIRAVFAVGNKEGEMDYRIDEIVKLIKDDCCENISLTYIAEKLELTPAYVSRIFKKHMKMNFNDYLTNIRIEKAKLLLGRSKDNIKVIASQVGYSDSYYFSKVFKNYTGLTPGQYRKSIR